ncbi:nitrogen regulation protein NR(II) [Acidithiobacillus sp. IBUN Pt1247-S3]|uniref:two-component system sensor histidine kinase NtrB n=1 Tax=Acidithiobacillus sp. IBUN Pt1247-S3 TaxID=3166642 RepID=UPI0034E3C8FD
MQTGPVHRLQMEAWSIAISRLLVSVVLVLISTLSTNTLILESSGLAPAVRDTSTVALIWSLGILFTLQLWPNFWQDASKLFTSIIDIALVLTLFTLTGGLSGTLAVLPLLLLIANAYQLRGRAALAIVWILILLILLISGLQDIEWLSSRTLIYIVALLTVAFLADNLVRSRERNAIWSAAREQEIIDLNTLNREIIQQTDAGLLVLDRQHRVLFSNPIARAMIDFQNDVGLPEALDLLRPELADFLYTQGSRSEKELQLSAPDGIGKKRSFWVQSVALPNTPYNLITLRDATILRERQREVQMAALGRLAANIAHEIRNPLSAIRHAAQLLGERTLNDSEKRLLNIIDRESQRLNRIVDSVLEMARPRAAHPEPISLAAWLPVVLNQLREDPGLKDLQIALDAPNSLPLASCDPEQLQQVFANLLLNAARYGRAEDGTLQVDIAVRFLADRGELEIRVRDHGPGIPQENMERIFEPFFTTESLGTGLGLPLVRELLRANQADIEIRNHRGGGAEFIFKLSEWHLGTPL